ncbi:uncharacterized protein OCT59_026678 [Rhizophagus irregularis]|uniref:uncharacterized protein n=1 Tax=Rhizophagus irregularis TaxID=588596 RepID=UPI0019D89DDB|nr:hypothetical protein OCT59_026678 [Rhizophagus irregularis]GBC16513.2 hypothetical protein RIR_jg32378.t1 [Rhizophagus irregularis DAOM 181602=DAOM 197198]
MRNTGSTLGRNLDMFKFILLLVDDCGEGGCVKDSIEKVIFSSSRRFNRTIIRRLYNTIFCSRFVFLGVFLECQEFITIYFHLIAVSRKCLRSSASFGSLEKFPI